MRVIWLTSETRTREILPYITELRQFGHHATLHFEDIFSTPQSLPTSLSSSLLDGERYILVIPHSDDQNYGAGSWGWETSTSVKSVEYSRLVPLVRPNTIVILFHPHHETLLIDSRITELGVHIETSYSAVMNRIITESINSNDLQVEGITSYPTNLSSSSYPPLPIVKRLVFIRHAQRLDEVNSEWSEMADRPQDTPLTTMGIQQSKYVGTWLSQQSWASEISNIYVSPFVRTVHTAHYALESFNQERSEHTPLTIPINIEYGLCEGAAWMSNNNKCQTPWHLKTADLYCLSPQHISLHYQSVKVPQFDQGPIYPGRPVERELWYDRCAQTIWRLAHTPQLENQTIVMITHAGCIGLIVHSLSGRALPMIGHTAVTSLVWNESERKYEIEFNETKNETEEKCEIFVQQDHLPVDMRTGTFLK